MNKINGMTRKDRWERIFLRFWQEFRAYFLPSDQAAENFRTAEKNCIIYLRLDPRGSCIALRARDGDDESRDAIDDRIPRGTRMIYV